MQVIDILNRALEDNKFEDFLLGKGTYMVPSREGYVTDRSAVMHSGVYKKYLEDPAIKEKFENAIIAFLNGSEYELLTAFDYIRIQMTSEANKVAPFEINRQLYEATRRTIIANADKLKQYRHNDFGGRLQDGAYQYINNVNNALEENFGTHLL